VETRGTVEQYLALYPDSGLFELLGTPYFLPLVLDGLFFFI
jgi:hypothetical protein